MCVTTEVFSHGVRYEDDVILLVGWEVIINASALPNEFVGRGRPRKVFLCTLFDFGFFFLVGQSKPSSCRCLWFAYFIAASEKKHLQGNEFIIVPVLSH